MRVSDTLWSHLEQRRATGNHLKQRFYSFIDFIDFMETKIFYILVFTCFFLYLSGVWPLVRGFRAFWDPKRVASGCVRGVDFSKG